MKLFKYRIISEEEYQELRTASRNHFMTCSYSHWFSGWPNVYEVLKAFARGDVSQLSISTLRRDFAKSMNTDEYGNSIKAVTNE